MPLQRPGRAPPDQAPRVIHQDIELLTMFRGKRGHAATAGLAAQVGLHQFRRAAGLTDRLGYLSGRGL